MQRIAGFVFLATLIAVTAPASAQSPKRRPILPSTTVVPQGTYPAQTPSQMAAADPGGYTPAPMPDSDEAAPTAPASNEAQWSPSLFRAGHTYRGEGFVPGSSVQGSQNRNVRPAPGISLNVPLQ